MAQTDQPFSAPRDAYPPSQRQAHAEQHILAASAAGFLDCTSCTQIARTYGVPQLIPDLKALKRGLFPEFLCGGDK
jgi:hypothetical protein